MAAPRPQQLLLLLLLVSLLAARRAEAWGKEGHIMTCKIAEVSSARPLEISPAGMPVLN
jgi:hypothetical protein